MSGTSKIEWTDASWNPIRARDTVTGKVGWHCEHVSEGCRHCYAETMNGWRGTGLKYQTTLRTSGKVELYLDEKALLAPLHWRKPRRMFVCSMTDLYADFVPDAMIDRVLAVIALCPQHKFQVLTKRPERMREYLSDPEVWARIEVEARRIYRDETGKQIAGKTLIGPLPNVWLGVSAENQATLDARAPHLLATPAAVRFLSLEPLLGAVTMAAARGGTWDFRYGIHFERLDDWGGEKLPAIHWVILGGESGPGARPMHPDWARQVRDQCGEAGVPFFFKQWGEWAECGPSDRGAVVVPPGWSMDERMYMHRVGKKKAGALQDGVEHREMPGQENRPLTAADKG